jgi:hypothetical protein
VNPTPITLCECAIVAPSLRSMGRLLPITVALPVHEKFTRISVLLCCRDSCSAYPPPAVENDESQRRT